VSLVCLVCHRCFVCRLCVAFASCVLGVVRRHCAGQLRHPRVLVVPGLLRVLPGVLSVFLVCLICWNAVPGVLGVTCVAGLLTVMCFVSIVLFAPMFHSNIG
jgi:hypothetical protein